MTWTSRRGVRKTTISHKFRSRFEKRVAEALDRRNCPYEYETFKIEYEIPARKAKYTPDFRLPNDLIIEVKGWLKPEDRAKHLLIKAQRPEYDIRFVFQGDPSKKPIYRGSPTTYAMWCDKHGFKYAHKQIPVHWIKERPRNGRTKTDASG